MTINPIALREKIAVSADLDQEERDLILEALALGVYDEDHVYPTSYSPEKTTNPHIICSWAILDNFAPTAFNVNNRFLLAGMIAGALTEMYALGRANQSANKSQTVQRFRKERREEKSKSR